MYARNTHLLPGIGDVVDEVDVLRLGRLAPWGPYPVVHLNGTNVKKGKTGMDDTAGEGMRRGGGG